MAARFFGRGRQRDPREPQDARNALLVDYRLESVSVEHLDQFYRRVGYRERLDPGLLAHVGGVIDQEELVYLSVWRTEDEAMASWQAKRSDIEAVLADAPPDAQVTRRASGVHRLYLGDDLLEFREGLADGDPDCIGFVIDLPEVDDDSYDLMCRRMDFPGQWPDGLLMHVAGRVDDFFRVLSIWRRADQSRRFFEDRLIPASVDVAREHGLFPEIRPRELRVHLMALNNSLYE